MGLRKCALCRHSGWAVICRSSCLQSLPCAWPDSLLVLGFLVLKVLYLLLDFARFLFLILDMIASIRAFLINLNPVPVVYIRNTFQAFVMIYSGFEFFGKTFQLSTIEIQLPLRRTFFIQYILCNILTFLSAIDFLFQFFYFRFGLHFVISELSTPCIIS